MKKKHQVFNLIILDESGSMQSIKDFIIRGFNELVQSVKGVQARFPDQEHLITVVSFNGLGIKTLLDLAPVGQLELIDDNKYVPDAMTPLYDAMGTSITKLRKALHTKKGYNVLVTILTDGEENDSKEYDGIAIKKLVDELKTANWTFTYIGTDHNVERFAHTISITNTLHFQKNEAGISKMFAREREARSIYSEKIQKQESVSEDFYTPDPS